MNSVAYGPAEDPRMEAVAALARRLGPRPWSDAGRRPARPLAPAEVPGVAAWMVDAADAWWRRAGRPDPWTLVVVSADEGDLAAAFLALGPECLDALRYVLVDPARAAGPPPAGSGPGADAGPDRRPGPPAALARRLALEEPEFLYPPARHPLAPHPPAPHPPAPHPPARPGPGPDGPGGRDGRDGPDGPDGLGDDGGDYDPDDPPPPMRGIGPLVTWLAEIPVPADAEESGPAAVGAVVAVEEVSRLPADAYQWRDGAWWELRLAATGPAPAASPGPGLEEISVPARPDPGSVAARLLPADPGPGRHEVAVGAAAWLRSVLSSGPYGHVAVLDGSAVVGQLALLRPPAAGPEPVGTRLTAAIWRIG